MLKEWDSGREDRWKSIEDVFFFGSCCLALRPDRSSFSQRSIEAYPCTRRIRSSRPVCLRRLRANALPTAPRRRLEEHRRCEQFHFWQPGVEFLKVVSQENFFAVSKVGAECSEKRVRTTGKGEAAVRKRTNSK